MFLQYSIVDGPLPVADYLSTMKLTAAEEGCELEWSGDFNAAGASDEDARETMTGIYQMGFDGLAKLFA
jgi:hypothetical protein